ncbi:CopD family protein [Halomarina ordinaria]|uniref:CopD family protein n=1 Tax=Halomarina ordinaria TaxID=3033939 RepID=A0ABD5U6N4_9EURY|nr:CopD family protein [Halomarina sp. PSRA2]
MSAVDTVAYVVHLLFAGLWTGAVLFVTVSVLPLAERGDVRPEPLSYLTDRLTTVSRVSAVALLLSGGHMAGTGYTVESLFGSGRGHLVLTMVALWLALAALVEIGAGRMRRGLGRSKVRTPANDAKPFWQAGSAVALGLLVVAGLLAGGLPF